jgi:Zn-dependent metalloprotease
LGAKTQAARTVTPITPVKTDHREAKTASASRAVRHPKTSIHIKPSAQLQRIIYTAKNREALPGDIARREDAPPTGDAAVDEAYAALGLTYTFFRNVFGRNSIDNKGMPLRAIVHYGSKFNNAFWMGEQMVLGDGDGRLFKRLTLAPEIIAKEFANGMLQHETKLIYFQQSGCIFESLAIVLATLVKQYDFKQTVDQADWLIGDRLLGRSFKGKALFSLGQPGTAYDDPALGKDPQPAHMKDFVKMDADSGGIHVNSGILNHAFYLVATALGGYAWERAGRIWYATLSDSGLKATAQFSDFARLTFNIAKHLYDSKSEEARAVKEAWGQVGIPVKG